ADVLPLGCQHLLAQLADGLVEVVDLAAAVEDLADELRLAGFGRPLVLACCVRGRHQQEAEQRQHSGEQQRRATAHAANNDSDGDCRSYRSICRMRRVYSWARARASPSVVPSAHTWVRASSGSGRMRAQPSSWSSFTPSTSTSSRSGAARSTSVRITKPFCSHGVTTVSCTIWMRGCWA